MMSNSVRVHYAIYLQSSTTIFDKLKWEAVQRVQYTDHGLQICSWKSQFSCCFHTAKYHYLFEGHKVFECQAETDLLKETWT